MNDDEGRLEIVNECKYKEEVKERLKYGQIVFCKGREGTGDFYGIVYEHGIIELPYGSNVYIYTKEPLHLGDTISYWTIEKVYKKVKLVIEE